MPARAQMPHKCLNSGCYRKRWEWFRI